MNRVFITGDTHGVLDFNKLINYCASHNLDRDDYIIIAGDCGVVWSEDTLSEYIAIYEKLGATILYIDGNHENFDMLESYPITTLFGGRVHKISDNIYHLFRGDIFDLCGKKIFAFGGGESNDKTSRIEHKSWWSRERITSEDYNNAIDNLAKCNNKVDYVVSHMPPTSLLSLIEEDLTCCGEELPWYMVPKLETTISSDYLQNIASKTTFRNWFYGHLHIDLTLSSYTCVYDRVLELK